VILDLTPAEHRAIVLLREIKKDAGHGTLRVEVTAGYESLLKQEFSEKLPR
jgi:hypothetical protein